MPTQTAHEFEKMTSHRSSQSMVSVLFKRDCGLVFQQCTEAREALKINFQSKFMGSAEGYPPEAFLLHNPRAKSRALPRQKPRFPRGGTLPR